VSFVPIDFPREVLVLSSIEGIMGYRLLVKNEKELESYWRGRNGSGNVFFTTYGYRGTQAPKHHRVNYDTPMIHHFVMDFDCKDFRNKGVEVPFEIPQQQVKDLHQYFIEEDIKHYVWFSGGGFHVWIMLDRTHTPSSGSAVSRIKHAGRKMVNEWHKMFNLRCNDPGVYFDTARMIRIPNSYNAKRGCWMMPLTTTQIMENTYEDFMEQSQDPHRGFIQHGNTSIKLNVKDNVEVSFGEIETVDVATTSLSDIHILPCIAHSAMGEGNPPHRARVFFASYLADRLRNFRPHYTVSDKSKREHIQQISQICGQQGWVDYDPIRTEGQVASIVTAGYSHPTCSTLYMEGFCLGKCKYYDGTGDEI